MTKSTFVITVIAITVLCFPAFGLTVQEWYDQGAALATQGRYDEALRAFDKAIELDPNLTMAWNYKCNALNNLGKYYEAMQAVNKAIELDPKYAMPWNGKGYALNEQGKYDEAIPVLDKAIELDPKYAKAWNNKGYALYRQGRYDEAVAAYDKATELDPNNARAWNNKGDALEKQGKHEEAIQAHDKAIKPTTSEWERAMILDRRVIDSDFNLISAALKSSQNIVGDTVSSRYDQLAEDVGKALRKSQAFSVSPELQNAKDYYERGLSSYKFGETEFHRPPLRVVMRC